MYHYLHTLRKTAAKKAFTLIELLVVIAIIAILAAILFPVFAQAKLAAKKTVALSNAKQIALASYMYMNDNDDALIKSYFGFPAGCAWGTPAQSNIYYTWRWALNPYLAKSNGIISDPTNPFQDPSFYQVNYTDNNNNTTQVLPNVWAVNSAIIGFANNTCGAGLQDKGGQSSLSAVGDVSGTIMMMPSRTKYQDMPWDWGTLYYSSGGPKPGNIDGDWCMTAQGASSATCPATGNGPIHAVGKTVTFIWADSHAKAKPYSQTLRVNDATGDDWDSSLMGNAANGDQPYTQQDRINAVAAGFVPEYQ